MKTNSTSNITDEQIKKCPNCGAEIGKNSVQCPYCEFLLSDKKQIIELDKKINYLEDIFTKTKNLIPVKFIEFFIPTWLYFSILFLIVSIFLQISDISVYAFNIVNIIITLLAGKFFKKGFQFYFYFIKTKKNFKKQTDLFLQTYPDNLSIKKLINNFNKIIVLDNKVKKRIKYSIFTSLIIFTISISLSISYTANITTSALGKNVILTPKKIIILKKSKPQIDFNINDIIIENNNLDFVFDKTKERFNNILPPYEVKTKLKIRFKNPQQFVGHHIIVILTLYKNGKLFFGYNFRLSGAIFKENFIPKKIMTCELNYFFDKNEKNEMNKLYIQLLHNTNNLKAKFSVTLTNDIHSQ